MKTSEVFALVKENLWDGTGECAAHNRYIYYQLEELCRMHEISTNDRNRCKRIVSKLLGINGLLESWLFYKHDIQIKYTTAYYRKVQATRRAWLDHLIEHYRSQGK